MKRLVLLVAGLSLSTCAAINGLGNAVGRGDVRGAVEAGNELEAKRASVKREADKCNELQKKVVTYEEETQIGGAVALALASKTSGVVIDLSPDLSGNLTPTSWTGKKPKPGSGDKTQLTAYLDELGKGLAAYSSRPEIDWTFVVLEHETPNAFSAPGGYVFITTGMINKLENEAQLAAVLAHEIGHVTGRHAIEQYKKSKVTACTSAIMLKLGVAELGPALNNLIGEWGNLIGATTFDVNAASADLIEKLTDNFAESLTSVGMGPDAEFAADRTALELMVFGGYDPLEYEKLIKRLPDGGFMTPHPKNADRLANLKKLREQEFGAFTFAGKAPPLGTQVKAVKK